MTRTRRSRITPQPPFLFSKNFSHTHVRVRRPKHWVTITRRSRIWTSRPRTHSGSTCGSSSGTNGVCTRTRTRTRTRTCVCACVCARARERARAFVPAARRPCGSPALRLAGCPARRLCGLPALRLAGPAARRPCGSPALPCSQAATFVSQILEIGFNSLVSSACCNDPWSSSGFRQRAYADLIATRRRLSRVSQCVQHH